MTQYAIVTDLERCVGCMSCVTACKMANNAPIGNYWNKILRIGPNPKYEGAVLPDVETYWLPIGCQHCENPACVQVCPTQASHKLPDGTVQVDKSKCIGCQFCAMACPYGVRYLNEEERVVEKCTLCEQRVAQGELPQCVINCGGHARFFGDVEKGVKSFESYNLSSQWEPGTDSEHTGTWRGVSYDEMTKNRTTVGEWCEEFTDDQVYHLPNVGNDPSFLYILRQSTWQGGE